MSINCQCPYCKRKLEYYKDEELEKINYYAFSCDNCAEGFLIPKSSYLLKNKKLGG